MFENQKSTTLMSIQVIYCDKICIAKYNQNTKIQLKKCHKRIAGGGGVIKLNKSKSTALHLEKLWMVNNEIDRATS